MEPSKIFQALSHPVRIKIMEILKERGDTTVNELHALCGASFGQSAMSQHLAILREVGLVESRKESQRAYYSVCPDGLQSLAEVIKGLGARMATSRK